MSEIVRTCKFEELIYGTPGGTIHEGEQWVNDFYHRKTAKEAREVIAKHFGEDLNLLA